MADWRRFAALFGTLMLASGSRAEAQLQPSCAAPANAIQAENCQPGTPKATWYPSGSGDATIQGFPTDISVNAGQTISFKVKTTAGAYRIEIYRMGYYGGTGARLAALVAPSASLPQTQPACLFDSARRATDCGNWAVSASWVAPSTATSGIYLAKLVRGDTGGSSFFQFVVRNDASRSDILFQHSDTTFQAYNTYGGYNVYNGPTGRAYAASFNRPPSDNTAMSSLFAHEQPVIRFMEANGYDVSYFTESDTDRSGSLLLNHKLFLSVGHDEYWSGADRANVEAAVAAGVHLAFLSANEVLWKVRWDVSFDASKTPHRTLVCYKERGYTSRIDPLDPPTWTGFWRDPAGGLPDDARPENSLSGSWHDVGATRDDTLIVRAEDGKLRFWRGTRAAGLASGQTATFPEMLGYEWDDGSDNGHQPAGLISLSSSTYSVGEIFTDNLSFTPGQATHALRLHRHASGALVFAAGTMQWGWGLDAGHNGGATPPDPALRQAMVNLLADMGLQPATLQAGLVAATQSTDTTAPTSSLLTPGQTYAAGTIATISGTAADSGGGVVAAVEVSTDNGVSWHPAVGRESWSYGWVQHATAFVAARSRAVDDSGNLEGAGPPPPPNPAPTLASLSPSSAAAGSAGFTLTAFGSNFLSTSTLLWNGVARATTFISSTQLSAAILNSDLALPTSASVTVFNPDGSGPSNAVSFVVSSTSPPPSTASIFTTQAPTSAGSASSAIEVGVKFRSDVNGSVTGVRFYKLSSANSGTHVGDLWSRAGALLASATFTGETPSGWQTVLFSTPVVIQASTTYVVSYHTTTQYSVTRSFFTSAGVYNPPLRALQSGVDGVDGVYAYGSTPTFPVNGVSDSNWWVDVVFSVAGSTGPAPNPAPTLSSVAPSSAAVGGASLTLTALGAGFVSSSTVRWNGQDRATTLVTGGQLNATILAADLAVASTAAVTVFSPGPGGGTSTPMTFTTYVPNPAPALASLSPSSATVGGSSFTLTAFGSGFMNSSTIRWNGLNRLTVFISSGQLNATVLAADLAAPTSAQITAFSPGPGGGISATIPFLVYGSNLLPSLASISPSSAAAGGPAFTLSALGSGFISSSTVLWNGTGRPTSFVNATQLTAQIPSADIVSPQTASVTVSNPGSQGGTSAAQSFVVSAGTGTAGPVVLYSDNFNRPNALITNSYAFSNPNDPTAVLSGTWTVTAGSLFVDNNTAWTGVPDSVTPNAASSNGTGSAMFRAETKRGDFGDVVVGFTLTTLGFVVTPTSPAQAFDAVQLALRYVNENSYYDLAFNRRDNTTVMKKKAGPTWTTLASANFAVPLSVPQAAQASVRNNTDGSVTLTLSINGQQLLSVVDNGLGGAALRAPGAVGFRGSNVNFRFDDLVIQSNGAGTIAAAPSVPAFTGTLDAVRVFPNPWRADRHAGLSVTIDGLAPQSEVRIYTVSGQWVRTIDAPNGTGQWDLLDVRGARVASGLYLYLTRDSEGRRSHGVLAVVR